MTRGRLLIAVSVAALAVGASPAWAQRSADRADPDSRPTGPERTGTAVDRGSSSGSTSSSPSSGGSGSSSAGSGTSVNSGGGSAAYSAPPSSSASPSAYEYVRAPQRPAREERAQGRARSGSGEAAPSRDGGSPRAVPRGESGGGDRGATGSRAATPSAEGRSDAEPSRRAVPTYSRPRDGSRQPTGTAIDRRYPAPGGGGPYAYPSYSTYYGRYYFPGYAFGLGYFHDPGWYDPYYYGGGYGGGYGYGGGGAYGGGSQGGYGRSSYGRGPTGSLRLKIQPRDAQVYVDGYFVGVVDSFDGVFQRLAVDAGGHRIEIKSPGHQPISFDVLITPGETVTYKGELRRIR